MDNVNRVRCYKKVHILPLYKILAADGKTVLSSMLTEEQGNESMMNFPREEPARKDCEVYKETSYTKFDVANLLVAIEAGKVSSSALWQTNMAYRYKQVSGFIALLRPSHWA